MSNRFISLCLAVLLLSNIFFYSILKESSNLTFIDIIQGKIINQSLHLLCFGYILINKSISKKDPLVISILVYFGFEFLNEIINYIFIENDTVFVDSLIISLQRITLTYAFVKLGSQIISSNSLKNIIQLILIVVFIYCLFLLFRKDLTELLPIWFLIFALFMLQLYGSNVDSRLFHQIYLATILIVLADSAFVYSGINNDVRWEYLYLLPRLLLNLGELMIFHKILEKYKPATEN